MRSYMLAPKAQIVADDMDVMLLFDNDQILPWLLTRGIRIWPEKLLLEFLGRTSGRCIIALEVLELSVGCGLSGCHDDVPSTSGESETLLNMRKCLDLDRSLCR